MNKVIKHLLNTFCICLTRLINWGQILICYIESKKLYKVKPQIKDDDYKRDYDRYRKNLRKYGFRPSRRDFAVFRDYLKAKGSDPALIVPPYVINNYVTPVLNPIDSNAYFENKNMFDRILPGCFPETYLRRIHGRWYDAGCRMLSDKEAEDLIAALHHKRQFIVKPAVNSSSGRGVAIYESDGKDWIDRKSGRTLPPHNLFSEAGYAGVDLVVQEVIAQHPFFSRLCPTAVSTMRVVMYNSPVTGNVESIWCGIRIGKDGSIVDNIHAGGLMFGISRDGVINNYGIDTYGNKYSQLNGIDFSSSRLTIPHFDEILRFAAECTEKLIPNRFIAFDISLTQEGRPVLVEYNLRGYGGWLCQFSGDPMLGDKTDEILEYVSTHSRLGRKVFYSIN